MRIELFLNGRKVVDDIPADMMLLDFVRKQGMKSVKQGCDTGNCGLCTLWLDGKPVLSCSTLAHRASNRHVTTLEGVQKEAEEFTQFLAREGADQCGFCSPGFIMAVLALKKENPHPTAEEMKEYLAGNLCRCTGYQSQYRALVSYFEIEEAD